MKHIAAIVALVLATGGPIAAAEVTDALRAGREAVAKGDLEAASAAYRRALTAGKATEEQRQRALDGLRGAAVAAGRTRGLMTWLEGRVADAPEELRRMLLAEQFHCRMLLDGHLQGAIDAMEPRRREDRDVHHVLREFQQLSSSFARLAKRQAHEARRLAVKEVTAWRPDEPRRRDRVQPVAVPQPERPSYSPTRARLEVPRERRVQPSRRIVRIAPPRPLRYQGGKTLAVRQPTLRRPSLQTLAAIFLRGAYRRATELGRDGFLESAKAELASVMQLFPQTPQAEQAAGYAIRLFQRERGVADHAQADALVAYMEWVRAIVGPQGLEQAEYTAIKKFAGRSDPWVVAREAEGFLKRHPDSKSADGVRLRLAVALDAVGDSAQAIQVLRSVASPIENSYNVRAVRLLAWLYLFEGQPDAARKQLQALASQTVADQAAADAREMLERMAKTPPRPVRLPPPEDPEAAEAELAERLYTTGHRILASGDAERAMDLFALFLRLGKDTPHYWAARQRIGRLRQKGQVDNE